MNEKEVKIGEGPDDLVEILDGLKEGEGIALPVNSVELRDGGAVEVVH